MNEELTYREIKDLKDGVPNYGFFEVQGPTPPHEYLCCECTGSGCKQCKGIGYIIPQI